MDPFNELFDVIESIKLKVTDAEYMSLVKHLGLLRKHQLRQSTISRIIESTTFCRNCQEEEKDCNCVDERLIFILDRNEDIPRMLRLIFLLSAQQFGI